MPSDKLVAELVPRLQDKLPFGMRCQAGWSEMPQRAELRAPYNIVQGPVSLGAQSNGLPSLDILIQGTGQSGISVYTLADNFALEHELVDVVIQILPVSVEWNLYYEVLHAETRRKVTFSTLGKARLGSSIVFEQEVQMNQDDSIAKDKGRIETTLINTIINIVQRDCLPSNTEWESRLRQSLSDVFQEPFQDGQILTARYINLVEARIQALEQQLQAVTEKLTSVNVLTTELQKLRDDIKAKVGPPSADRSGASYRTGSGRP